MLAAQQAQRIAGDERQVRLRIRSPIAVEDVLGEPGLQAHRHAEPDRGASFPAPSAARPPAYASAAVAAAGAPSYVVALTRPVPGRGRGAVSIGASPGQIRLRGMPAKSSSSGPSP